MPNDTPNDISEDQGKGGHALVTGCSSGIGRAITVRLLADGWNVTGISRRAPAIESARFRHIAADLGSAGGVAAAAELPDKADALIHAAGILRVGAIGELAHEDGDAMWRLHVEAAARLVEALAPAMPNGGRIVFIGSRVAAGAAGKAYYAASKVALEGLARSFAAELAPRAITVNVIAPAATETPMLTDPQRQGVPPKQPPMGRFVQPEEVAGLAAFLLGDAAASITGQRIVICAGSSL